MYSRILVPLDGSETARAGLLEALAISSAYGSELVLLHVIDDAPVVDDLATATDSEALLQRRRARGKALLEESQVHCAAARQSVQTRLRELHGASLAEAIVQEAQALGCSLIVIGSHGRRGLRRLVMGSDAESVLRETTIPVIVVRAAPDVGLGLPADVRLPYRRLLVPVDGSETATRGLDEAIHLARVAKGRLRLVHAIDDLSMAVALNPVSMVGMDWLAMLRASGSALLEQAAARVRASGLEVETLLVDDFKCRLCNVIANDSKTWLPDVVVIGSHGRRGFDRALMGSDAELILRHALVPVLIVPPAVRQAAEALAPGGAAMAPA